MKTESSFLERDHLRTRLEGLRSSLQLTGRTLTQQEVNLQLLNAMRIEGALRDHPAFSIGTNVTINIDRTPDVETDYGVVVLMSEYYHELAHVMFTARSLTPFYEVLRKWKIATPDADLFEKAHNILEEGRVETLFSALYGRMKKYFAVSTKVYVLPGLASGNPMVFPLLHGRRYLPDKVRQAARDVYTTAYDAEKAQKVADIVDRYRLMIYPDDVADMAMCIYQFMNIANTVGAPQHGKSKGAEKKDREVSREAKKKAEEEREKEDEKKEGTDEGGEDGEREHELDGDPEKDDDRGAGDGDPQDDGDPDAADQEPGEEEEGGGDGEGEEEEDGGPDSQDGDGEEDEDGAPEEGGGDGEDSQDSDPGAQPDGGGDVDRDGGDDAEPEDGEGVPDDDRRTGPASSSGGGVGSGKAPRKPMTASDLREALEEAAEGSLADTEVQQDIGAMRDAMNDTRANLSSSLRTDPDLSQLAPVTPSMVASARRYAEELRRIWLQMEPGWNRGAPEGRLDMTLVFEASVDGDWDKDMFAQWDEGQQHNSRAEMVIVADVSGSMDNYINYPPGSGGDPYDTRIGVLSRNVWEIRSAAKEVEAEVTVLTYETECYQLHKRTDPLDSTSYVTLSGRGGTQPAEAIHEARRILSLTENEGKILVVISDGEWPGDPMIKKTLAEMTDVVKVCIVIGARQAFKYREDFDVVAYTTGDVLEPMAQSVVLMMQRMMNR